MHALQFLGELLISVRGVAAMRVGGVLMPPRRGHQGGKSQLKIAIPDLQEMNLKTKIIALKVTEDEARFISEVPRPSEGSDQEQYRIKLQYIVYKSIKVSSLPELDLEGILPDQGAIVPEH